MSFGGISARYLALLAVLCGVCAGQSPREGQGSVPQESQPIPRSDAPGPDSGPALGANESSSRQTQIDISPPSDDAKKHPDSDISDVTELHSWNPHKAEKDVEIGEFYMKRKNYKAAEDRFREALEFKPGDAIATFRLGEVLEAQGQGTEAAKDYQEYLRILPTGKFSNDAKKGLARLGLKTSAQAR